ncbi:hypothetical protein GN958_ATG06061 [Phytophthora infestans]|uniref:Uncharacterized protein n=1 Tax=Phytophthora infestans TaxID=4787 RepID=A0A8S9UUQ8_PHYIN|nr:hypothetical protein GN958_ATG06061 [Phytophthora infestans]
MLARIRSLEYLDVLASTFHLVLSSLFNNFHLEKLPAVRDELSVKSILEFLSIMPQQALPTQKRVKTSRCLPVLDRNTISLIFAFAATRVL